MPARYIVLGCSRRIGLGAYVKAWKQCLALSAETWIGRGVDGYGQNAGEALRDLRRGMHDRINRHLPDYGKGRKWDSDWQRHMTQAAHAVNHPRLIIDWLPAELMTRFAHRLRRNCV